MAASLSYHLFCFHSYKFSHLHTSSFSRENRSINPISFKRNPNSSSRFRALPKSKPNSPNSPIPPLLRFRDAVNMDELGQEIISIALPALLALAADPITSLVDTAFVGHLGSVELAAVGVSVSVFNLVSKLFNVPLLNVTTSFIAEEQASMNMQTESSVQPGLDYGEKKKVLSSVSSTLVLAAGLGVAEAVALSVGSGYLMNIMGFTNAPACRGVPYNESFWRSTYCHCTCCTGNFQRT